MKVASDKLIDLYYRMPGYFLPYKIRYVYNKLLEKLFTSLLNKILPAYFEKTKGFDAYTLKNEVTDQESGLVVSLTSFPDRILTTHLAIESILRQSVKPDKIILWLASEQFPKLLADIPEKLKNQINRGLEIRFCEDLRSHKKYYFAMKNFPKAKVILIDDDLFYHRDLIKNLIHLNKVYPKSIVSTRVHRMKFVNGKLLPYKKWILNTSCDSPRFDLHHNSGHGTLIDCNSLHFDDIFFDKELIRKLSLQSDDVWFKVNLIRLKITVATNSIFKRDTIGIKGSYKSSLVSKNTHQGLKDKLFNQVFTYFNLDPSEETFIQLNKSIVNRDIRRL
jgi:hypothetical protein